MHTRRFVCMHACTYANTDKQPENIMLLVHKMFAKCVWSFSMWNAITSASQFSPCAASRPVLWLALRSSASAAAPHPWCAAARLPGASCAAANNHRFPLHQYYSNTNTTLSLTFTYYNTAHTHTRLMALCPGLPGWASTRKVKLIWILLKQETVSGTGISWAICKSAPRSRQITTPAPHHSVFNRPDALPAA